MIKKNCNGAFRPSRRKNEVDDVVAIDIPRLDCEPARRRNKFDYFVR